MIRLFTESLLKSVNFFANYSSQKSFYYELDYTFKIRNRHYKLDGIIKTDNRIIGLEIPTISSFDKPCGTAAYYATIRLNDAISANIITEGRLFTSNNTKGKRFQDIIDRANGKIFIQEFNQESANLTIKNQKSNLFPPKEVFHIAKYVF